MAHYIDADLLRKEVEKRMHICNGIFERDSDIYFQGKAIAYRETLSFIDSLQQEQPDFPTTDEQMKEFLATHPKIEVPEKYKNPDWMFDKSEKPMEGGLEEEIERYLHSLGVGYGGWVDGMEDDDLRGIARHFAQWGAEHKKIEPPCHTVDEWIEHIKNADQLTKDIFSKGPYDVLYDALNHPYQHCYDAIKEFGELCYQTARQDMMKEAVKWLVDDDYHEATEKGRFILGSVGIGYNGYYIPYSDLLKLPKED